MALFAARVSELPRMLDALWYHPDGMFITDLLPPLRLRVGLILLAGGPHAYVITPAELVDAGQELARTLLAHYEPV